MGGGTVVKATIVKKKKAVQEGFGGHDLSPDGKFKVLINELDERRGFKI